jgi:hypothetical protein
MKLLSRKNFSLWIAFSIYAIITGILSLRHTMWRDELQLWLVASKSSTFSELFKNISNENRPMGYFMFCWIVSRFTSNPEWLKLTNWLISVFMSYIVLFELKIRNTVKILFLCGVIPLIGYSHIAQDYMLGTLLFIILIKYFLDGRKKTMFFFVAFIIANIHILFLFASAGFVLIYFLDSITISRNLKQVLKLNRKLIVLGSFYGVSCFVVVIRVLQADGGSFGRPAAISPIYIVKRCLVLIASACFPFFDFQSGDQSNQILSVTLIFLGGLIFALLLAISLFINFRNGIAICVSNLLLIAGMSFGYSAYWWHFGVLYLSIFGSLLVVLGNHEPFKIPRRIPFFMLGVILVSQIFSLFIGPRTNLWEIVPYSTAEQTANFLKQNCDDSCTIITNSQTSGSSISGYMNGRDIYFADIGQFGSFARWGLPATEVTWDVMISSAKKFENAILVTSVLSDPPLGVLTIKSYSGAIWPDENFTVSRIAP